jgi:hypothetical protein
MVVNEGCTVKGYLYGVVCGRFSIVDAVAEAEIIAVVSEEKEVSGESLARVSDAQELKRAVRRVQESDLQAALERSRVTMRAKTEADGSYCLVQPDYEGGLLDLYVAIQSVPLVAPERRGMPLSEPVYLHLGTYEPVRPEGEALLKLLIPQHVWCWLKKLADAWTIVGKVTACDDPNVAIGGLTVFAFDVDWTQDDPLGSDTTSSGGIFRIDYPGDAYRQGTFIDVELFGGPDVYFRIEDSDGNVLLSEPPSKGRSPGRADSGPCLCVDLCVDVPVPQDGNVIPSIWTGIGTAFTIPDASSLNDFDADGYAGLAKYAFTDAPRMTGSAAAHTAAGNPIEYRFLVSDTTGTNGDPPLAAGNFTRTVGVSPDDNLFVSTKVAQMVRFAPFKIVDVWAKLVDLDPDGWLDVNKSIERTFIERPDVDPIDLPDFQYVDSDGLMQIDTSPLTTEPDVPDGAAAPGQPVPVGDRIGIEKIAIRFEVREVIDKATSTFGPMLGNGTTLNAMVINNNPAFMKLAMTEHLAGTPCDILNGTIHVAYTVHHPHLRAMTLTVTSNDGTYNVSLSDPPELPLSGNTNPAIVHKNNPALAVPNGPSPQPTLHKCTYLVVLTVTRRLHTGDDAVIPVWIPTTFYWEP